MKPIHILFLLSLTIPSLATQDAVPIEYLFSDDNFDPVDYCNKKFDPNETIFVYNQQTVD